MFAVRASIVLTPGVSCNASFCAREANHKLPSVSTLARADAKARAQAVREVMAEAIISDPRRELDLSLRIYHDVESKAFEGRVPSGMTPITTDCISVRSQ